MSTGYCFRFLFSVTTNGCIQKYRHVYTDVNELTTFLGIFRLVFVCFYCFIVCFDGRPRWNMCCCQLIYMDRYLVVFSRGMRGTNGVCKIFTKCTEYLNLPWIPISFSSWTRDREKKIERVRERDSHKHAEDYLHGGFQKILELPVKWSIIEFN